MLGNRRWRSLEEIAVGRLLGERLARRALGTLGALGGLRPIATLGALTALRTVGPVASASATAAAAAAAALAILGGRKRLDTRRGFDALLGNGVLTQGLGDRARRACLVAAAFAPTRSTSLATRLAATFTAAFATAFATAFTTTLAALRLVGAALRLRALRPATGLAAGFARLGACTIFPRRARLATAFAAATPLAALAIAAAFAALAAAGILSAA